MMRRWEDEAAVSRERAERNQDENIARILATQKKNNNGEKIQMYQERKTFF